MFFKNKNYQEIIHKAYLDLLKREPDKIGFNHFLSLLQKNEIDDEKLRNLIQDSYEYKKIKKYENLKKKSSYVFQGKFNILYNIKPTSFLDNFVVENGIFDEHMIQNLADLIPKNSIIFDVGANTGLLSIPFAKILAPEGIVYAFEPDPENFFCLLENVKINKQKNIVAQPTALQDDSILEKIILHKRRAIHDDGRKNTGLSTIESNTTYVLGDELVKCSTIDKFVMEKNIKKIDFIKIDVEGSDSKVLSGANETIKKYFPIIIYEFSPQTGIDDDVNSKSCFSFLKNNNYIQYQLTKNSLNQLNVYDSTIEPSNILCIHKSHDTKIWLFSSKNYMSMNWWRMDVIDESNTWNNTNESLTKLWENS